MVLEFSWDAENITTCEKCQYNRDDAVRPLDRTHCLDQCRHDMPLAYSQTPTSTLCSALRYKLQSPVFGDFKDDYSSVYRVCFRFLKICGSDHETLRCSSRATIELSTYDSLDNFILVQIKRIKLFESNFVDKFEMACDDLGSCCEFSLDTSKTESFQLG
jgi:hypothetical protein